MDPVTIAASIAAVKTAIGAAKNIQSIGHSLDDLFNASEAHAQKKQKPKAAKTRMQQVLRMRAGDANYDDDTSISAVANKVLEEKQNQIALENLAKEIDRKWGKGTWGQILQQRKRLIAEKKASEQLIKENALRKAKDDKIFWHKVLMETGKVALIICFAGLVFAFLWWAATANISDLR